jgi:hypothetical protein
VVDGFRFNIDAQHDLMPAVEATRSDEAGGVLFKWKPMQQASGWFVQAMGMRGIGMSDSAKAESGEMEMVYWTSSELPDMGMGLVNYQPNGSISKWQKEKVLLPASASECVAPKEAVGPMAMSRIIAYGEELNMVYPPRPKDPKVTWEQQWDVKVRLKSVASLMPGMGAAMHAGMAEQETVPQERQAPASTGGVVKEAVTKGVVDSLVRGLFKR